MALAGARGREGGDAGALIAHSIEGMTSGMVAASYALIGCLIGGVLSVGGVLLGVRMGRRFRELPRVKCVAANWELAFEKAGPIRLATCTFKVDLFNEGQLATGLRGVSVALRVGGEGGRGGGHGWTPQRSHFQRASLGYRPAGPALGHANAYAAFEGKDARMLSGFQGANLLGQSPDGRGFDIAIVRRGNFLASSKKVVLERQERIARRNLLARFRWHRRPTG